MLLHLHPHPSVRHSYSMVSLMQTNPEMCRSPSCRRPRSRSRSPCPLSLSLSLVATTRGGLFDVQQPRTLPRTNNTRSSDSDLLDHLSTLKAWTVIVGVVVRARIGIGVHYEKISLLMFLTTFARQRRPRQVIDSDLPPAERYYDASYASAWDAGASCDRDEFLTLYATLYGVYLLLPVHARCPFRRSIILRPCLHMIPLIVVMGV